MYGRGKPWVILALMGVMLGVGSVRAEMREWNSATGSTVQAEFVERQGDTVLLRNADGETLRIRMSQLSREDQLYVGQRGVSGATPAPTAPAVPEIIKELFGERLVDARRRPHDVSRLAGKKVAIYFSAQWCPPCRAFTPELVKAYEAWAKEGAAVDVVFVSRDRSPADLFKYMRDYKMPWVALPHGAREIDALLRRYEIRGIPALVVIDAEGNVLSRNGVSDIRAHGKQALQRW